MDQKAPVTRDGNGNPHVLGNDGKSVIEVTQRPDFSNAHSRPTDKSVAVTIRDAQHPLTDFKTVVAHQDGRLDIIEPTGKIQTAQVGRASTDIIQAWNGARANGIVDGTEFKNISATTDTAMQAAFSLKPSTGRGR